MSRPGWLHWPWSGTREAKAQLRRSEAQQAEAEQLVREVAALHAENRIATRIHAAMRGRHA